MKVGDSLNGYVLTTETTNSGGGMSQWCFASKNGAEYFVKMFLSPKFPLDGAPGSPLSKARKRDVCLAFEARHLEIARRLDPTRPGSGNLVVPRDFFRVEATYVKVMDRVDAVPVSELATLTPAQLPVVLRSTAFSLRMLHEQSIVHGDVKLDNVLVEASGDLRVAKLIDFDEAYIVGSPPLPEHIVGDTNYYSPELLRYVKKDPRLPSDALGTASDMFSLALLVVRLLTGAPPGYDRTSVTYPAEAMLAGQELDVSAAPIALQSVLTRMLDLVPRVRPAIDEFIEVLLALEPAQLALPSGRRTPPVSPSGPTAITRPRSTTGPMPGSPTAPPTRAADDVPAGGGLRSTMGRRPRPGGT